MIRPDTVIAERYRVIRLLGEGGMGSVFEAEHTGVGRKVAVKVLNETYAKHPSIVERFQREARSAAAIGHDNIIDVIDFGVFDGAPFMVMEYLKGESLGERLERKRVLPVGSASYILAQVLSALSSAHAAGIIHRDLKPDNVFLVRKTGMPDFVKLLDFGIAKLHGDDTGAVKTSSGKSLTQSGVMMGTPLYMAPEQALAKKNIDQRADIYSAGVMLYEMVAGAVPFDVESQAELLMEIVYRPKGVKSPREKNPEVPEEFAAIVMKAMAKEREDRYETAAEMLVALEPYVELPPNSLGGADGTGRFTVKPARTVSAVTPLEWEKSGAGIAATLAEGAAVKPLVAPASKPSRAFVPIVGAAALLIVSGAATYALRGRSSSAQVQTQHAGSTVQVLVPASPSATVAIDLEQLPPDAVINIDDHVVTSPHLVFPRGSSHALRVTAPGREPYVVTVVADRERSVVVPLAPIAASHNDTQPAVAATTPASGGNASAGAGSRRHGRASGTASTSANRNTNTGHAAAHSSGNPLLPVSNEY